MERKPCVNDISLHLLDRVQIATRCNANWEDMRGDDVSRHCDQCNLDVFDLSAMSRVDAEAFLQERMGKGRVCARIYRRADGRILTRDCPVGLARVRARAIQAVVRMAAMVALLAGAAVLWMRGKQPMDMRGCLADREPWATLLIRMGAYPPAPSSGRVLMGDVAMPSGPGSTCAPSVSEDVP